MSVIEPGWYKDPVDPSTQKYWDGEGWLGDPLPADATPPPGPPPVAAEAPAPPAPPAPLALSAPPAPAATPQQAAQPPVPAIAVPPGYVMLLPEPRPHGLMLAGAGSRFVARMVDILAVLVLCVIANFWFAVQFWQGMRPYLSGVWQLAQAGEANVEAMPVPPDSADVLLILMTVVTTAVWFAYEVPASANSGQTLGKKLLGIKVVRLESEERLGFGRSFRRWGRLGLPTLFWAVCFGLTMILQFIDCLFVLIDKPLRQALHDKSAATVVIQVPRDSRPETAPVKESATVGGRDADPR